MKRKKNEATFQELSNYNILNNFQTLSFLFLLFSVTVRCCNTLVCDTTQCLYFLIKNKLIKKWYA